jgi:hypothetical protein
MFWSRGSSRQRKAVLSALSAVGETGMTLLALGFAVNIPEGRLNTVLESLVRSGHVRRRGAAASAIPGPRTALYHLASGRHSALPGLQSRRVPAGTAGPRNPQVERLRPAPVTPAIRPGTRKIAPQAGMRSTPAQGI